MDLILPKQHGRLNDIARTKEKWVVLDKDDLLYRSNEVFIDWTNEQARSGTYPFLQLDRELTLEDYVDDWSALFGGISDTLAELIAHDWHDSQEHATLPVIEGAPEAVQYLRNRFKTQEVGFAVLTADRAFASTAIGERLDESFPAVDLAIFSGQYDDGRNNHTLSKRATYDIFRPRFVGDDGVRNVLAALAVGAHVAMPRWPWNQRHNFSNEIASGKLLHVESFNQEAVEFAEYALAA